MHEIDTKKFLAEQISQDINKFRNADAFLNAGRERISNLNNGNSNLVSSAPDIIEDIMEREHNYEEDNDDNASTLSKELMMAKQQQ